MASGSDDAELQMSGELATGTLAIILARQGRQAEAQEMVEKVSSRITYNRPSQRFVPTLIIRTYVHTSP